MEIKDEMEKLGREAETAKKAKRDLPLIHAAALDAEDAIKAARRKGDFSAEAYATDALAVYRENIERCKQESVSAPPIYGVIKIWNEYCNSFNQSFSKELENFHEDVEALATKYMILIKMRQEAINNAKLTVSAIRKHPDYTEDDLIFRYGFMPGFDMLCNNLSGKKIKGFSANEKQGPAWVRFDEALTTPAAAFFISEGVISKNSIASINSSVCGEPR